jgi:hypothetical protein
MKETLISLTVIGVFAAFIYTVFIQPDTLTHDDDPTPVVSN